MVLSFQDIHAQAGARWRDLTAGDRPWVRVGSALCGEAAGCQAVLDALESALERHGVEAKISRVGCLGLCFAEPLVDVQFPNGPRIFYGNVTPESVNRIVAVHLSQGNPVPPPGPGIFEQP